MPGVKNYNVLVREKDDQIVFLRKIVPGAADKSYGIQVARLAGLPPEVIDRAKEILANLEEGEFGEGGQPKIAKHPPKKSKDPSGSAIAVRRGIVRDIALVVALTRLPLLAEKNAFF